MMETLLKELELKINKLIELNNKLKRENQSLLAENERLTMELKEKTEKVEEAKRAEGLVEGLIDRINRLIEE